MIHPPDLPCSNFFTMHSESHLLDRVRFSSFDRITYREKLIYQQHPAGTSMDSDKSRTMERF